MNVSGCGNLLLRLAGSLVNLSRQTVSMTTCSTTQTGLEAAQVRGHHAAWKHHVWSRMSMDTQTDRPAVGTRRGRTSRLAATKMDGDGQKVTDDGWRMVEDGGGEGWRGVEE